jgi:predicted GIY-YIG superfamily endonuclease
MTYFVYILASRYKGTIYVGVTRDLSRRMGQHKSGAVPGFTREYKSLGSFISNSLPRSLRLAHVSACSSIGGVIGKSS